MKDFSVLNKVVLYLLFSSDVSVVYFKITVSVTVIFFSFILSFSYFVSVTITVAFIFSIYTVSQKVPTFKLSVTLSNRNRFSNFLHCRKAYKIATKSIRHYSSHLRRVATLPWKIKNANSPNNAQLESLPFPQVASRSVHSVGMRRGTGRQTDTDTHTAVDNIHFASATPHAIRN